MPNTSLNANKTRNKREKNVNIVKKAIRSSLVHRQEDGDGEGLNDGWDDPPAPKVERPSARRTMWSMCCSAAVVAGFEFVGAESTEREVAGEGTGRGTWVARNM